MLDAIEQLANCNKFVVSHTEPRAVGGGGFDVTDAEKAFTTAYAEPAITKI